MGNKINELISQLELMILQSPKPKLTSGNKKIVDADAFLDLLSDLKVSIPEEVRVAQNILSDKENIISKANEEVANLLGYARKESERLIADNRVIEQARKRAEDIVLRAEQNAKMIADGARNYTDEILLDVQRYMVEYIGIIEANRQELVGQYGDGSQKAEEAIIAKPSHEEAPVPEPELAPPPAKPSALDLEVMPTAEEMAHAELEFYEKELEKKDKSGGFFGKVKRFVSPEEIEI